MTFIGIGFHSVILKGSTNSFWGFLWLTYYFFWSFSYAVWRVVICITCKVYVISKKKHITYKNILNKNGRSIDPCGTPATISSYKLNWSFVLNLRLRSVNNHFQWSTSFNDPIEKSYSWSFATVRSCGRQSNKE